MHMHSIWPYSISKICLHAGQNQATASSHSGPSQLQKQFRGLHSIGSIAVQEMQKHYCTLLSFSVKVRGEIRFHSFNNSKALNKALVGCIKRIWAWQGSDRTAPSTVFHCSFASMGQETGKEKGRKSETKRKRKHKKLGYALPALFVSPWEQQCILIHLDYYHLPD